MATLTKVSDYIGLYQPEEFGVSDASALEDIIRAAIGAARLTLLQVVPESTYNDAVSAFASGSQSDDQEALRWAEYWYTRYNLEGHKVDSDVIEEQAGWLRIRRDPELALANRRSFLTKATHYLKLAGYELGGGAVAGVRGGDPLPPRTPWFSG